MTFNTHAKDRAKRVKQAVDARGDKAKSSAKLRAHPDYPAYVNVIGPDDEYQRELLERAWQKAPNDPRTELASDEQLLRPRGLSDTVDRNNAVYRSGGIVQQLVAKRTRQVYSVLGRVGVIDIYKEQLETTLKERGLKLTNADLARVILDKDDPTPQDIAGIIKLLSRLNAGRCVNEGSARTAAGKLHLWVEDLVFDSAIYENAPRQRGPARKRRSVEVQRTQKMQSDALRKELRCHRVPLTPLRLSEVSSVPQFHSAVRASDRIQFEPLNHAIESDTVRRAAIANFKTVTKAQLGATGGRHAINQAWAELENLRVQLWMGQYEDLVPLGENEADPPGIPKGKAKSRAIQVLVIAFGDFGLPLPSISKDLSHTVDLMPSVEQLLSALMDDPPP